MDFYDWKVWTFIILFIIWRTSKNLQLISNITNRHVFITGCDHGFGRFLAKHLDKRGVNVYAGCYLSESMKALSEQCSTRLKPIPIDVTDSDSVERAAEMVQKDLGQKALWGLVNNAGIAGAVGPIEFLTKKAFQDTIDVNLLGFVDVTINFLPLIKKGREGRIVNISSIYGRVGFGFGTSGGYALSKHGIEAFSDGLSYDLAPYGISVHTLNPGFFKTPLSSGDKLDEVTCKLWNNVSKQVQEEFGEEYIRKSIDSGKATLDRISSPDTYKVVQAYADALLKKYPQNRYAVGWDAKLFYIPLSYLPVLWQIAIATRLQKFLGIEMPVPKFCLGK